MQTHTGGDHRKTQGEGSHLQARVRPQKEPACGCFDLGLLASTSMRGQAPVAQAARSVPLG